MQQIADLVGVHVTTVSRAVDDKWVQTPRGIFPLKRFFGGGTQTASGEEVAWETIKQKLLEIIDKEDKSNPLSDEDLVDQAAGVRLSRRPPHGDEVPQDAQHPVVAAAEGLDACSSRRDRSVATPSRSLRGRLAEAAERSAAKHVGQPMHESRRAAPAGTRHPPGRRRQGHRPPAREGPAHRPRTHRPPDRSRHVLLRAGPVGRLGHVRRLGRRPVGRRRHRHRHASPAGASWSSPTTPRSRPAPSSR